MLEVCWSEDRISCVLRDDHCWHVQFMLSPTQAMVRGARRCCWCGRTEHAHTRDEKLGHGPFRLQAPSLLDLAIEGHLRGYEEKG
jgi:hypothetical protein